MPSTPPERPPLADTFWRLPLVPVALAGTAGIVYDRFWSPPLAATLTLAAAGLAAWLLQVLTERRPGLALAYLLLTFVPLGAAYHHYRRNVAYTNQLGSLLTEEEPASVQLRGILD